MTVEVGQVLDGKYRIVRLIGKGGMGAVYEAEHLLIDRRVAVKELHAEAAAADHAVTRFEREARAAGRIGSDHILQIFDVGTLPDGSRYMVSELLDGETLATRLRRMGRLSPAELFPIAQQLLIGLGAAHEAKVLHRDLKPDNIFLVRQKSGVADFVKIIDFGIAKFQPGVHQDEALKMTKTGMVVGTPYYLSPEQARGTGEADARSDLYAVGVILYECITGEVPFSALNFNELIFKIVLETPQPPAERVAGVDPLLSDLVLKAMARDPTARFQSAKEMKNALSEWAAANPTAGVANFGSGSWPPSVGQTPVFAAQPFAVSPSVGGIQQDAAFRTLASPTPASFGTTRNPRLSVPTPPVRSRAPLLFLLLGGAGLLVLVVGFTAFRRAQNGETAAVASVAHEPASAPLNAPTTEVPVVSTAPAPAETAPAEASPAATTALGNTSRAPAPKVSAASHAPAPKRAASTPASTPTAQAAPAEPPKAAPKKRGDWGY